MLNTFVSGGLWHSRSSSPSPSSATSLNHVTASLLLVMSSPSTCTLYKWEISRSFFFFFYEKVINEPTWILLLMLDCFVSQEMKGQFHFCVEKSGVFHGFTAWFTVCFESLEAGGATVELNTGPNSG